MDKDSNEYRAWWATHSFKCKANFEGSAPAMESEGAERIFGRSIGTQKLRYYELYGHGDSKSHTQVENIYEANCVVVEKKE
jgi:hypothetical protein